MLGHVVSSKGIEMIDTKIKAILKVETPKNSSRVANFLGFVNFYRRFITKLRELAAPMYALTKKGVEFNWSPECQAGFEAIKRQVAANPFLSNLTEIKSSMSM